MSMEIGRTTLWDAYLMIIRGQLESVIGAIENQDSFHLDALVFSLNRTRNFLDWKSNLSNEKWSGNGISFHDYERLIKFATTSNSAGINLAWTSQSAMAKLSQQFRTNFDILYVNNIFDEWTLNQIRKEVARLWGSTDIEPNCNLNGVDRLGGYVHHPKDVSLEKQVSSSLYSLIFGNEPLHLWVSSVVGVPMFPSDFPIELREYGGNSRGMACHSDIQMYEDVSRNLEVVFTLSNFGKCEVYWYDRQNVKHSVWPEPNSITLVQPDSAVHCVSDTQGGYREILKFILVGDYRKHRYFYDYVDNICSKSNPNVLMLNNRRRDRAKVAHTFPPSDGLDEL